MDQNFLLTSGGTALISALIIQAMKKSELTIFNFVGTDSNKARANLYLSIVIAFFTSLGIGFKYDETAGTILLTGITSAGILHGLWHWFVQWVGQHIAFKTLIMPQELQSMNINVLEQLLNQLKVNSNEIKQISSNTTPIKS